MGIQSGKKGKGSKVKDNALIGVVGQQELLNELLSWFLKKDAGLDCSCALSNDQTPLAFDQDIPRMRLVLLDCAGFNSERLRNRLVLINKIIPPECKVALFNVNPNQGIEKEAAYQGVRGVFYQNDPLETMQKGIPSILDGDLWFSRETLFKGLQESRPAAETVDLSAVSLTSRESEVLLLLAGGMTNDEIAEELYISSHTVKKHISKIYFKIGVTNRLQAAMWAKKYLDT